MLICFACTDKGNKQGTKQEPQVIKDTIAYGYNLNDFNVLRDTIKNGDTFGAILNDHGITNKKIFTVATKFRDSFDVRRMVVGKPYLLLKSQDTLNTTQVFIYEKNKVDYAVIDFRDTLTVFTKSKPVTYVEKEASGIIQSSLYLLFLIHS